MIRDKYLNARGGNCKVISILCRKCNDLIFIYQKDGPGHLKRCYLNRIIFPLEYQAIYKKIKEESDLTNLKCKCDAILGNPIRHSDGRLAFRLIKGRFLRK